ncbi:type II CAAX prenyl endopeptidase Rce1 family protein [Salinimicrobium sp. GXAS 041]|uniref:CPBP family glutamic-type intramembrane protease n=1 Tax=Salinimicrobium sp. GXAS 041 TaxID=3400806 RepID=UPI003C76511E
MSLNKVYYSNTYRVFEFLLFFIFIPFITVEFLEGWWKIIPLLLIALFFLGMLLNDPGFDKKRFVRFDIEYFRKSIPRIIAISILLVWFTFWIFPHLFMKYPLESFYKYLITFFLYPVVSVLPQEIIYRMYFFHRYKSIVPERYLLMLSNAIIFALTHFIYGNWVAPIATFLVSWIFIFNYLKSKSLLNVSLEHYIYGLIMFTVGFGHFFA